MDDAQSEWRRRAWGPPLALVSAALLVSTPAGRSVGRIFFSMWVHEAGHAVAAWWCGHAAFPGPWRTPISEGRSALCVLAVAALNVWIFLRGRSSRDFFWMVAGALLGALQAFCTLGLSARHADALILFAGDGGLFVLGTLAMATVWADDESVWVRNQLRWGFLVIGAVAFAEGADTWWGALRDVDRIPFGEQEGVGLSDPSRLVDIHGWAVQELVHRYVGLSVVCATALAALYMHTLIQRPRDRVGR